MTLGALSLERVRSIRVDVAIIALACIALAAREVTASSIAISVAVGIVGWVGLRAHPQPRATLAASVAALAVGVGAFALARVTGEGFSVRYDTLGIAAILLAAVSEEALFRGYLHERLAAIGTRPIAIGAITASVFAAIHVPTYGLAILPLDLAAGAVLAWQRQASGTWIVPAITHAAANLMQL